MRHPEREITETEAIFRVLEQADTIRVGFNDAPYPYVVPVSFGCEMKDGRISVYFHGARAGRKYALLRGDPRVCVEADHLSAFTPNGHGGLTADYESVIGFGVAESLSGDEAVRAMALLLAHCGFSQEGAEDCIKMDVTEMTRVTLERVSGKRRFPERQTSLPQ